MATSKTLSFELEKETKGAVRYSEVDENGHKIEMENVVVGTIYIRKSSLGDQRPAVLTVTVQY